MITISAAILILSFAMKNLASLDWGGVAKGLVGISGLAAVLLVVSRVMSQNTGKLVQAAAGMVIFAVALRMLVKPVQTFGAMKKKELENGLGSVAAILSGFVAFTRYVGSPEKILSVAAAMVIFTVALRMMVKPVEQFAAMDEASLAKGILSVGTILAGIVGFTRYVGSPDKILSVATGMVLIGAAMLIFGKAVEQIGNLSYEQLAKGMLTIAVSLIMIVGAVNALPATTPLAAVGLVLIAAALNLLALALTKLGKMSWGGVVKSLVALAGSLTIIAVAVTLMMAALPGAAALVVVAGALAILAPVLKLFGSMSMAEIGKSLLMLAASFGVIGVAGLLLAPIVPVLLALGAAILLLGTGVLACGAGILALSAGITALAVAGTAGIAALVLAIEAFLSLLPQIAIKIGEGFVAMMMAIGNAADGLCIALTQILLAIIQALAALIEPLVDVILQFVTVLLEKLAEYTPRMVKAGIDLIVGLIEGLAQGIEQNADRIKAALESLLRSLITLALTVLGIHSPSTVFKNIAVNIVLGLIQGLTEKAGELKTKAESVISGAVNKVRSKIKDFKQAGIDMMNGLKQGVEQCKATVIATATNIGSGAVNAIKKLLGIHSPSRVFASIGEMMDRGWIQGIQTFGDDVSEAAEGVGQTALSGMAGVIAHISDSLDNDLDMQPTIRPVLDLSDIQNGVKRFRKLMPESNAYGMGASFGLANRVLQSMKERQQNIGSDRHYGDINLYANFTNANQRDGMALLGMLNRELGGALL